ncbi:DUF1127 domain-containing protein [Xanthobacter sp. KR7-225]|uniref:DUF1127 domain-containing protein n=1 Tax=Xanthobacter sp. KR7-225 TaxID=3156613 RepID=UPI0032B498A8
MIIWGFLARRLREWRLYRLTVAELSELDDRSLADINVSRSDIHSVARRAAIGA